ncbi:unnamed protein product [Hydatigera taeniaeformis]|uniref:Uncharacterized protein n=1 Tax=Hydatigena taeniaeformis TaxID=6205 RepID=A0A0R3X2K9_HYDTA|nr:unnamed protein product [Hydatigera taeniaeformis]
MEIGCLAKRVTDPLAPQHSHLHSPSILTQIGNSSIRRIKKRSQNPTLNNLRKRKKKKKKKKKKKEGS